ncbi:MAG: zinc ribbon domain-containing protein [Gemmatimonadetes bacterium]|nr:zinc ribbon domain-containing protein [Gemmatimonadota bacterium]
MPTYEYRCTAGHEFEIVQKMSDDPVSRCPKCGAASRRLLSAGAGLLFKGGGFYITDYRSDAYRKAAKADTSGGDAFAAGEKTGGGAKGTTGDKPAGGDKGGDATSGKRPSKSKPGSETPSKAAGSSPSSGSSG